MTTYRNDGSVSIDFTLGPDSYESIRPGETKALKGVKADNRLLQRYVASGVLVPVEGTAARKASAPKE